MTPNVPDHDDAGDSYGAGDHDDATGLIVVGVDGSEISTDALRWARRQRELSGGRLLVIAAWYPPISYSASVVTPDVDLEGGTQAILADVLTEVFGSARPTNIESRVVYGNPAQVLLDAANGADLLVVGSRGHGGLTGMLLGSVSKYCVTHAKCPVIVFRPMRKSN